MTLSTLNADWLDNAVKTQKQINVSGTVSPQMEVRYREIRRTNNTIRFSDNIESILSRPQKTNETIQVRFQVIRVYKTGAIVSCLRPYGPEKPIMLENVYGLINGQIISDVITYKYPPSLAKLKDEQLRVFTVETPRYYNQPIFK